MTIASTLAAGMAGHARLALLRLLNEQPGYVANDSVLTDALELVGLPTTRAQVVAHLEWMAEVGLVSLLRPSPTLVVATATERGCDVARGRAMVSGVARPSAGN